MLVEDVNVTRLLDRARTGDESARAELWERVYPALIDIAQSALHNERVGHTLQPAALVNELAVRLLRGRLLERTADRTAFFALATQAMRSILVDHARRRAASKRPSGSRRRRVLLDEAVAAFETSEQLDLLALDEALRELELMNARQHEIVMLHFFGGLRFQEIAEYQSVSLSTVEKDWRFARAWLRKTLG